MIPSMTQCSAPHTADDRPLGAHILATMANQAARQGQPAEGVTFIETALAGTRGRQHQPCSLSCTSGRLWPSPLSETPRPARLRSPKLALRSSNSYRTVIQLGYTGWIQRVSPSALALVSCNSASPGKQRLCSMQVSPSATSHGSGTGRSMSLIWPRP